MKKDGSRRKMIKISVRVKKNMKEEQEKKEKQQKYRKERKREGKENRKIISCIKNVQWREKEKKR